MTRAPVADEHARTFHEAQRSADTIFSHYQLSQLLATHELPVPMAEALLDELVHVCGSPGGAIWLRDPAAGALELAAQSGSEEPPAAPPEDAGSDPFASWVRIDLEDVGVVALAVDADRPMDLAARRFLSLVRHELAIALRGALLRATLERERTELAAIISGASDAIVLVDAERRVTRLNPAAEALLGRGADGVIGQRCEVALRCDRDAAGRPCEGRCPFAEVLRSGEPIDGAERSIASAAGNETVVVGSYSRTASGPDGGGHAVGILRDTTEIARLSELRRGFLGSVSHELRTPLALIKGYTQTLLDLAPDPATVRTLLARIDVATDRLEVMLRQIIDASQPAAEPSGLDRVPLRIESVVRESVDDIAVREPSLEVGVFLDDGLPPVVGDRERLRQVLDNLLDNAVKYRGDGTGIEVEVRVDGDDVVIRVADRGIGIPADERELVFEQFHRGRNVRERALPGSGLGLAISRRLVEAHGGTIAFDPQRSVGVAAIVRLPALAASTTEAKA